VFGLSTFAGTQPPINLHVTTDKWWVTASVAVGSALLGSFLGAAGTYRASVSLEGRRRKALSEIRRKAKVYTPIREELVALQRAIAEDRHLGHRGVLRERPQVQTWRPAPVFVIWREFTEDGRANTMASERVRAALNQVDEAVNSLNATLAEAQATFKERGETIAQETGYSPQVTNWYDSEFGSLLRRGLRKSEVFTNPLTEGPAAPPPTTLTPQQEAFVQRWEADETVRDSATHLEEAEQAMSDATTAAIGELDAAMKRIADRYEHEPD
jgi:hypothetical protein